MVLLLALVGCSGDEDDGQAEAEATADDLATALEAGDFGDLDLSGSTSKEVRRDFRATVEGMNGREPTVEASGVEVSDDGDSATATLAW